MADHRGANQHIAEDQGSSRALAKRPLPRDQRHVSSCSTRMPQKYYENHWSIEDFSAQQQTLEPGEYIKAPRFGDNDHEFSLKLYPNGKDSEHSDYMSLSLHVNKCSIPRFVFQVTFTISTLEGPKIYTFDNKLVTITRSGKMTASKFLLVKTLNDLRELYTPNDVLTLGCELTVYGLPVTMTTNVFGSHARKRMRLETLEHQEGTIDEKTPSGDRFPSLLDSGDFSDFTIVASCGREFHTHMCILSTRSEYFNALFRNKTTCAFLEKRIKFDDISATTLEVILRQVYNTSSVSTIKDHHLTIDLAAAVDRLMVPSMRTSIRDMLTRNLSVDNFVTRVTIAAELRMDEKYEYLLEFFARNKKEAMETTQWLMLKKEKPQMTVKILEDGMMFLDEPPRRIDRRIIDCVTLD